MTIGVNADKSAYSCNIARPSGTTYLFFESYEISVAGGAIEHYGIYQYKILPDKLRNIQDIPAIVLMIFVE